MNAPTLRFASIGMVFLLEKLTLGDILIPELHVTEYIRYSFITVWIFSKMVNLFCLLY